VLKVGDRTYEIHRIGEIDGVERLPYTLRILLENVLRTAGDADVDAVAGWVATDEPSREINFSPGRAIHQDFTGVPAIVDAGSIVCFSSTVFHRSGPNTTDRLRRVYVAQYSPEAILNDDGDAPRHQAVPVLHAGRPAG